MDLDEDVVLVAVDKDGNYMRLVNGVVVLGGKMLVQKCELVCLNKTSSALP